MAHSSHDEGGSRGLVIVVACDVGIEHPEITNNSICHLHHRMIVYRWGGLKELAEGSQ